MAPERSPGPTNSASTPGTAAISSSFAIACGVSSCSTTPIVRLAVRRKSGVVPKREARLMPAIPRKPSGG